MTRPQPSGGVGAPVPLARFLEGVDAETGAELRAAAGRIDALARTADELSGVERRLVPWAVCAALLFIAGIWLMVQAGPGAALIAALCLLSLPGFAAVYALKIKPRTRADAAAQELNRLHFLPHGGLYFPKGSKAACVVRVDWRPPQDADDGDAPAHLRDPRKPENRIGSYW